MTPLITESMLLAFDAFLVGLGFGFCAVGLISHFRDKREARLLTGDKAAVKQSLIEMSGHSSPQVRTAAAILQKASFETQRVAIAVIKLFAESRLS